MRRIAIGAWSPAARSAPSSVLGRRAIRDGADAAALQRRHAACMSQHAFATIMPTLMVGWLMVIAGLGKKRLDLRPKTCAICGRRRCICGTRH
jgi:hypothetical protein